MQNQHKNASRDRGSEQLLIYNKFRNKSMLIIAHRLATVKNCDEIIMMDQGEVAERGSHEELLKKKGQYYRLWIGCIQSKVRGSWKMTI